MARRNGWTRTLDASLEALAGYVSSRFVENVPRILALMEHLAQDPNQRGAIQGLRQRWAKDPGVRRQAEVLARNPRMLRNVAVNWGVRDILRGGEERQAASERLEVPVPHFLLVDPTEACNLRCTGCWAGEYAVHTLPLERLDRLCSEAEELGIHWMVLSGGEPFAYKHLLELLERHPEMIFMAYTNGTLIDERVADRLAELGNLTPAISLEGFREATDARRGEGVFDQVMAAMDRLTERGVLHGASVTVTRRNVEELFSDAFIDLLIEKGVLYVWSFHYIPIGRDPDVSLMLLPEQRAWMVHRVREIRRTRPILIADFWNDGHAVGGCIAGGRQYLHINAKGDAEPCAFAHFATENVLEKPLAEALRSPLFAAFRARQPFNRNHLVPCPIIDNPQALRAMVAESGAYPTHPGADTVLEGPIAAHLEALSARWQVEADRLEAELGLRGKVGVGASTESP
ncbi:radical SAM protein [Limnochorda pilosa]|uniref:Radical SAM protein n=1 Tax=Limnochorda pilosa TaxID=1555112 RepID=A0A0K2SH71_LIMPI|nr:radical SAM protein [Limnochorda pilosa]BAS26468.1 radical SAM protein [Limnochorda pilosa]